MPISQSRYDAIVSIMSDPDVAADLTLAELKQARDEITEYRARIADETATLREQGYSSEQIAKVNAARKEAPEPTDGDSITPPPFSTVSRRTVSGVQEGAKRAVEGVIDLSTDLAVELGDVDVPGAPTSEDRAAWKQQMADRRTQTMVQNMQEYGQLPSEWSIMAGEVAPWLLALPASAATFAGLVVKRVVQGGVMGASQVQGVEEDILDRGMETTIGAGFGLASTAPEVFGWAKKTVAGNIHRAFNHNARHTDIIADDVRRMTGRGDFGFSTAQAGGGRFALGMEAKTANRATKEQQNRNLDILGRYLIKRSRELWRQGSNELGSKISPGRVARELRGTLKEARRSIYAKATGDWKAGHEALLAKYGDDIVVDGRQFLGKVDSLIAEQQNKFLTTGANPSKNLVRYRKEVDIAVNPMEARKNEKGLWQLYDRQTKQFHNTTGDKAMVEAIALDTNLNFGGMTSEETFEILKGLNNLIGGETMIFNKASPTSNRNIGRGLMGTFTASLKSNARNPAAVADIDLVRQGYAKQMQRAEAIDDLVVTQIFGGKRLPRNPGRRLDRVLNQDPEDLLATREFLEEWNEPLLNELRAVHMNRIVRSSRSAKQPDVDTTINLPKLAGALESTYGGAGQAGRGLYSAADQADMLRTAKALRVLHNKYFIGIGASQTGNIIEDATINVVSRSPEFMARFLARVATGSGGLEQKLLDQTFRQSIQIMAEKPLGTKATKAAMIALNEIANNVFREQEMKQEEAEREFKRAAERRRLQDSPQTIQ